MTLTRFRREVTGGKISESWYSVMAKITDQKCGTLSESDRLALAALLIKAGYVVRVGRERPPGKDTGQWKYFVEYSEG